MSDVRLRGREFNCRSGRNQLVSRLFGLVNHLGMINIKINLAFHPYGVGRSSTDYRPAWLVSRRGTFTCVGRQLTLCDSIWCVFANVSVRSAVYYASVMRHNTQYRLCWNVLISWP